MTRTGATRSWQRRARRWGGTGRPPATFAIETGPENAQVLRKFLDHIGIMPGIGVNFDPANLVMVQCEDIPKAVGLLGKYIVHTHAKDGMNLGKITGEQLYNGNDVPPGFKPWEYIKEVPLGEGQVPWKQYIAALRAAKFDGYLTIEPRGRRGPEKGHRPGRGVPEETLVDPPPRAAVPQNNDNDLAANFANYAGRQSEDLNNR